MCAFACQALAAERAEEKQVMGGMPEPAAMVLAITPLWQRGFRPNAQRSALVGKLAQNPSHIIRRLDGLNM